MSKVFKFREYHYDIEKLLSAVHSWLINNKTIDLNSDFILKIDQTEFIMNIEEGVDKNGKTRRLERIRNI